MALKNLLLLLSAGIAFISCSNTPPGVSLPISPSIPDGFVEKTLYLTDSYRRDTMVEVKLAIPAMLDTLLIWEDWYDDGSVIRHRFVNKNGCLLQESGFIKHRICPDSITRLTLNAYKLYKYKKIDKKFLQEMVWHDSCNHHDAGMYLVWKNKKIEELNNNTLAILQSIREEEGVLLNELRVFTIVSGRFVECCWECYGVDCEEFMKKAYLTIPTIQIDTICKQ